MSMQNASCETSNDCPNHGDVLAPSQTKCYGKKGGNGTLDVLYLEESSFHSNVFRPLEDPVVSHEINSQQSCWNVLDAFGLAEQTEQPKQAVHIILLKNLS
ncbi:unnamed protein product [Cylindrotheca closterium]|uniref:Uncharacterized protein n=1 Tax=Cylindrotheca closterium TaxID=2856 RepID=A0AAD2FHP4_9STRA|nr:unnamed protein product [Cylindrotheca closterium]